MGPNFCDGKQNAYCKSYYKLQDHKGMSKVNFNI